MSQMAAYLEMLEVRKIQSVVMMTGTKDVSWGRSEESNETT